MIKIIINNPLSPAVCRKLRVLRFSALTRSLILAASLPWPQPRFYLAQAVWVTSYGKASSAAASTCRAG